MEEATLSELKEKLREEEDVYAEFLAKLDRLAAPIPDETDSLIAIQERLNASKALAEREEAAVATGAKALVRSVFRKLVGPELARVEQQLSDQRELNSWLVQWINQFAEQQQSARAKEREFASALVGFSQRIDRLTDAKDRLYASLGNARSDLMLEAMEKRLERVHLGLSKARERLDGLHTEVSLARAEIDSGKVKQSRVESPRERMPEDTRNQGLDEYPSAFDSAHYVAFQDRFRGSKEEVRDHLKYYVTCLADHAPIVELGCGRGEFLQLMRDGGIDASGIDDNDSMVALCREQGLEVAKHNLVHYLETLEENTIGGIFSAQVIEHLPPSVLRGVLTECFRALKPGGRLVLETVNPRSLLALVESFYRDPTHEKPIHPETLEFLLMAAGFENVELVYRSPVGQRSKLLPVGSEDSAQPGADTVNQNFEKLNAFLYGDLDYAAIAAKPMAG